MDILLNAIFLTNFLRLLNKHKSFDDKVFNKKCYKITYFLSNFLIYLSFRRDDRVVKSLSIPLIKI